VKLLRQMTAIGPIRAALLVALLQTPHRFRTKRQLWTYSTLKTGWLNAETKNVGTEPTGRYFSSHSLL
jgi:hypothetical protein